MGFEIGTSIAPKLCKKIELVKSQKLCFVVIPAGSVPNSIRKQNPVYFTCSGCLIKCGTTIRGPSMEPLKICVTDAAQINNHTEKRYNERCSCEAIAKWSRFNETIQFNAKILNFSRSGIYLQAEQAIKPETIIIVRLEILLSGSWGSSDSGWLRTIALGKVQWCRELNITDEGIYGIGVRYYSTE